MGVRILHRGSPLASLISLGLLMSCGKISDDTSNLETVGGTDTDTPNGGNPDTANDTLTPADTTDPSQNQDTSASDQTSSGGDPQSDDEGPSGSQAPEIERDAPRIISLQTSKSGITNGEDVTIVAIVTDPDGIDDLIGGQLENLEGSVSYGAFATSSQEGSYALTLAWTQIHSVEKIKLRDNRSNRTFRATFYDQAGNYSSEEVSVDLFCDETETVYGVCGSQALCTDLILTTEHCGGCDIECEHMVEPGKIEVSPCWGGTCEQEVSKCYSPSAVDDKTTCQDICQIEGEYCGGYWSWSDTNLDAYKISLATFPDANCEDDENDKWHKTACDDPIADVVRDPQWGSFYCNCSVNTPLP